MPGMRSFRVRAGFCIGQALTGVRNPDAAAKTIEEAVSKSGRRDSRVSVELGAAERRMEEAVTTARDLRMRPLTERIPGGGRYGASAALPVPGG